MFKMSKQMKDELNDKGALQIALEAVGFIAVIVTSVAVLFLIEAYYK